jgi:tryptophan-rich sensory protein
MLQPQEALSPLAASRPNYSFNYGENLITSKRNKAERFEFDSIFHEAFLSPGERAMDCKIKGGRSMLIKVIIGILLCLSAGGIGSAFTVSAIPDWYATLVKPSFAPPNWIFAPAWTLLYILMGLAAAMVWQRGLQNPQVRSALIVFLIQLILNMAWSVLFFGLRSPLLGLVDILFLWTMILVTIAQFSRVSIPAALLLIPYILWVTFASGLNVGIFLLNK